MAFALLVAGAVLAPVAGAAGAGERQAEPVAKVAPGVYLTRGSDLASPAEPAQHGWAPRPRGDRSDPKATPRIVGGQDTTIETWPWQTSLGVHPSVAPGHDAFARHLCGATLVTPTILVSAAHCFFGALGPGFAEPDLYQAVTGRTQLSTDAGQTHELADYFAFVDAGGAPLYDPATGEWDVVFIELASSSSSGTIRIAGPGEESAWAPGSVAFITGWGAIAWEGPESDILQQAQIGIIDDPTCGSPEVYSTGFTPTTMLCAGNLAGGVDSCQGDSGGPLVVPIADGGFRLVGDTSLGFECARPNKPGVYGRVAADPMRSALRSGILAVAGVDVVGPSQPPRPVDPSPRMRVTINLRLARLERGAARTFRLRARNLGDAPARKVRVCVVGPKKKLKLAGKRCRGLGGIGPGSAKAQRFRVRAKPRARGRAVLRFQVRVANHPNLTERARVRIRR